jgi:ankyrin repeat protein
MTQLNKTMSNFVKLAMDNRADELKVAILKNNYSDYDYSNGITKAAGYGNLDVIKLLSECRDITKNDFSSLSKAVYWAARHGRLEVVSFLFEKFNLKADMDNSSAFRIACQHGKYAIVEYLFNKGACIHSAHNDALKKAIRHEHDMVASFLIEKGATFKLSQYDLKDDDSFQVNKFTPPELQEYDLLLRAAARGMENTMQTVMNKGLPHEVLNEIMIKAASYGMFDVFKSALDHGANINAKNVEALSDAARFNHIKVLIFIIKHEKTDRNIGMQRAIKKALDGGNEEVIDLLLPFVNSSSIDFDIPNLIRRCLRFGQDKSAIRIINEHKSLVSSELFISQVATYGSLTVLKTVMDIMPIFTPSYGSYVDAAIKGRKFENALYLLENDAEIYDHTGNLTVVAKHGQLELTNIMISAGADINMNNSEALMKSIEHNQVDTVKLLLSCGACIDKEVDLSNINLSIEMTELLAGHQ